MPMLRILGCETSLMDPLAGIVYLIRDFAQRELSHKVFFAMAIGAILSYFLATPTVALASVCAFIAGELVDWTTFTFSKKPLSQRLIGSSLISAPVDTFIFLHILGYLNWLSYLLMCVGKILGVMVVWLIWRYRRAKFIVVDDGAFGQ